MPAHPLQVALDRATFASYTAIDLIDIARNRLPGTLARPARPDARQAALYRAIITASIGGLEETFEGMAHGVLDALGVPSISLPPLEGFLSRKMQTPNASGAKNLLGDLLPSYEIDQGWSAALVYSAPAFRPKNPSSTSNQLHTYYNKKQTFSKKAAGRILDRFVGIRHTFAHQDSSRGILTKNETTHWFGPLATAIATTPAEIAFSAELSATCAVTVDGSQPTSADPIESWTVHEIHAINSLLLFLGIAATSVGHLAEHLHANYGVNPAAYDDLTLKIQKGQWEVKADIDDIPHHPLVTKVSTPYRPGSR